jgi:hypothetical protein
MGGEDGPAYTSVVVCDLASMIALRTETWPSSHAPSLSRMLQLFETLTLFNMIRTNNWVAIV